MGVSLAAASTAMAQTASDATVGEVVVTGTSIRGVQPIGSALQVIDQEALSRSGKPTLADILRELPANFAGGVGMSDNVQGGQEGSSAGGNLAGGQGVNLRGLGALSTLVLVDGRRVAASGQMGDFVDLSSIPAAAIERVEVLQDGASAIYGSDAVGGVVNVILKRRGDGFVTSFRGALTTDGGGAQQQFSQTYGRSWSGGSLFAAYEYNNQQRLSASDRDIFNGGDFSNRGSVNWRRFAGRAGTAANIFSTAASAIGTVAYTVPAGAGTGLTLARLNPVTDGVGNTYDLWENIDILPRMQRHSAYLSADQDLGWGRIHGDLRYTRRDGDYNQGYATLYGTVPNTSPYFITGSTNNFGVRIDDVGLKREVSAESLAGQFDLSFGLGGDWKADAGVSFSREEQNRRSNLLRDANIYDKVASGALQVQAPTASVCALSGLNPTNIASLPGGGTTAQRYCAALNYTPFNPYSTEPQSSQVLNQLLGYEDLTYTSTLVQGTFRVGGTLGQLPGGAFKVAAGVDLRRERIDGDLDFNYRTIVPTQVPYGATTRNVAAGFVEVSAPFVGPDNAGPLIQALELSAAVRYERGDGSGDYDTTNPKLGFRYAPVEGLNIRGSWGTSFHAPPMRYTYTGAQPTPGGNGAFVRSNLYTAPCNTSLVRLNGVVGTPGGAGNCSFSAIVITGAAGPDLKPEEARSWSLGADWSPPSNRNLKLGVNYFDLKVTDRIARLQGGTLPGVLAQYFQTGVSPYSSLLNFAPTVAQASALFADPRFVGQPEAGTAAVTPATVGAIINATQANLAALSMRGFDLSGSYRFDTDGAGSFDLYANGTWLRRYAVQASAGQPYLNQLGEYSSVGNPVKFRSRQGVGWQYGGFRSTLSVNYVSSYRCSAGCFVPNATTGAPVAATTPLKIKAWTTADLQVQYRFAPRSSWSDGVSLGLTVLNLTNEDPPFVNGGTAANDSLPDPYDAANATVIGRTVAFTISKAW